MKQNGTTDLDIVFTELAQDHQKNLLLASDQGIHRLLKDDIGVTNKLLDNNGDPVYGIGLFKLEAGTANDQGISTMAMVGSILLVGLQSGNDLNKGGLFWADISAGVPAQFNSFGAGKGISVNHIATERHGPMANKRAYVATKQGFLIFENDKLIEPVAGKGVLIDHDYVEKNRSNETYDHAASGFAGSQLPDVSELGIAVVNFGQDKNNLVYFAITNGGIFTLKIEEKAISQ